jgi:hypothetical protein
VLTSASLHDSQAAIPLATMTASRVINLYDLMDAVDHVIPDPAGIATTIKSHTG